MPLKVKFNKYDLSYLENKPRWIKWKVVAGNRNLNRFEEVDIIYDDYDLKIRKLI